MNKAISSQSRLKCNTNNQNVIPNIISQRLQVPWKITKFNPMSYTVTPDIALHWFSLETQWNDHDTDCWLFYKGRPPSRSLQGRDYPSAPPLVWWSPTNRGDIWCVKIFLLSKLYTSLPVVWSPRPCSLLGSWQKESRMTKVVFMMRDTADWYWQR